MDIDDPESFISNLPSEVQLAKDRLRRAGFHYNPDFLAAPNTDDSCAAWYKSVNIDFLGYGSRAYVVLHVELPSYVIGMTDIEHRWMATYAQITGNRTEAVNKLLELTARLERHELEVRNQQFHTVNETMKSKHVVTKMKPPKRPQADRRAPDDPHLPHTTRYHQRDDLQIPPAAQAVIDQQWPEVIRTFQQYDKGAGMLMLFGTVRDACKAAGWDDSMAYLMRDYLIGKMNKAKVKTYTGSDYERGDWETFNMKEAISVVTNMRKITEGRHKAGCQCGFCKNMNLLRKNKGKTSQTDKQKTGGGGDDADAFDKSKKSTDESLRAAKIVTKLLDD